MRVVAWILSVGVLVALLVANTAQQSPYTSGPFADDVPLDTSQVRVLTVTTEQFEDGTTRVWSHK